MCIMLLQKLDSVQKQLVLVTKGKKSRFRPLEIHNFSSAACLRNALVAPGLGTQWSPPPPLPQNIHLTKTLSLYHNLQTVAKPTREKLVYKF